MLDPRTVSLGSTMPNYQWLFRDKLAVEPLVNKVAVQALLERLPNLRLAPDETATMVGLAFRSPDRLPVRFDPQ